jgi:hypothetical protein
MCQSSRFGGHPLRAQITEADCFLHTAREGAVQSQHGTALVARRWTKLGLPAKS